MQRYPYLPPGVYPPNQLYQGQNALGHAQQQQAPKPEDAEDPRFTRIPAFYVVSITLGGAAGNSQSGAVQLRPEPFVLQRITWCTSGDAYPFVTAEPGYSLQGRSVTMTWEDEFTKLFGNNPALISSALGDSNGFLDLPRGALFQGKQSLKVSLTRLFWPSAEVAADTRFDFVFQGLSLLPRGVSQSGSAG